MSMTELLLLSSFATVFYVYFGYPLLLAAKVIVHRRNLSRKEITPSISVIVAVHNEERFIAEKLENTLSLDYPRDRLEVIVASDGSTDRTEKIASQYENKKVRLLSLPRCGKVYALNRAVASVTGEIVVFTDANIILEGSALRRLAANFSDSEVGGVCGKKKFRVKATGDSVSKGESLYWKLDQFIKVMESRAGSTIAADGSLYAIRKNLFTSISDPAQADDLAISVRVVMQGYRLVFEPRAVSYEEAPASSEQEFWRKVRVTNHSLRGIWNLREALNPGRTGFYAIELVSHKVLRYLVPFFLLTLLATNVALARASVVYQILLLGQLLFYGCSWVGYALRHQGWAWTRLFHVPFYFCFANAAACVGILSLIKGERIVLWQPKREISGLLEKDCKM